MRIKAICSCLPRRDDFSGDECFIVGFALAEHERTYRIVDGCQNMCKAGGEIAIVSYGLGYIAFVPADCVKIDNRDYWTSIGTWGKEDKIFNFLVGEHVICINPDFEWDSKDLFEKHAPLNIAYNDSRLNCGEQYRIVGRFLYKNYAGQKRRLYIITDINDIGYIVEEAGIQRVEWNDKGHGE